ncbi:hypothetical protein COLO4_28442 [Corchorus olitorius]|uniref:Uncharacterized protein n=1 Tax=Corchorus olitorius TaxID=93759 RepID=A0A1R3HKW8_9ROSI|nr:hypothetical protein COLO4_28442 [Corchorus olitorius]
MCVFLFKSESVCVWNLLGIRPEPDELEACTKDVHAYAHRN